MTLDLAYILQWKFVRINYHF